MVESLSDLCTIFIYVEQLLLKNNFSGLKDNQKPQDAKLVIGETVLCNTLLSTTVL